MQQHVRVPWELGVPADDPRQRLAGASAAWIAAPDPVGDGLVSAADLRALGPVIVQELFLTETARAADVVLPAAAWAEREGSFTTGERRVQRFYVAVPVTGEAKADFAITAGIAAQMGLALEGDSAWRAFDLLAAAVPSYSGLSYAKVSEVRPQWPIVGRSDMFYGGTSYENKGGMGAQLSSAASRSETVNLPKVEKEPAALRPKENEPC